MNQNDVKIGGGMYFSDIVMQTENFKNQCRLFEEGHTGLVQLVVEPPPVLKAKTGEIKFNYISNYTRDIETYLASLPEGMKVIIHAPGENLGTGFLDLNGVYEKHKMKRQGEIITQEEWNQKALEFAFAVALVSHQQGRTPDIGAFCDRPFVVAHPGYCPLAYEKDTGYYPCDRKRILARIKITAAIATVLVNAKGKINLCFENVPPLVLGEYFPKEKTGAWEHQNYWGIGSLPNEMGKIVEILRRCFLQEYYFLLDITHLLVLFNQMLKIKSPEWSPYCHLSPLDLIDGFHRAASPLPICHFSGHPGSESLIDTHTDLTEGVRKGVRDLIAQKEIVCLEMKWHAITYEESVSLIKRFREKYLSS